MTRQDAVRMDTFEALPAKENQLTIKLQPRDRKVTTLAVNLAQPTNIARWDRLCSSLPGSPCDHWLLVEFCSLKVPQRMLDCLEIMTCRRIKA